MCAFRNLYFEEKRQMEKKIRNVAAMVLLVIVFTACTSYSDLSTGLVGYWSFDNPIDPGHDDSGNGHNGYVSGAIPTLGRVGNALSFDGIDDYVQAASDAANILVSGSSCTVSLWVNVAWISLPTQRIIGCERRNDGFVLQAYEVGSKLEMGAGDGSFEYLPIITMETDRWYHVTMTFQKDQTEWKAFVDGQLLAAMTRDWSWGFGPRQLIIGADDDDTGVGVNSFTPGIIDEVRIYSRALELSEIQQLASEQPTPVVEEFYLHGIVPDLTLDNAAPTSTTSNYKDSPSLRRTEFKEIGTWTYVVPSEMLLQSAEDLRVWVGLKNSDDQGTYFDIRAELLKSGSPIASGEIENIQGVTRNPDKAKEVVLDFGTVPVTEFGAGDVLSLRILAKVTAVGGHSNAVGLRLYYDSVSRPSSLMVSSSP
jgi:hypothetical protein